ncbi:MAG TPA: GNAT family N-acetyltransferase [Anaerolineales bacterium]|nr:GNAT family N-acetyltransferase [Anaerolineales bacterium]HNO30871.1 GNAT family N-acetyltransferase [Anaerolineales bacterium]
MDTVIREKAAAESAHTRSFSRRSMVKSRLRLAIENETLTYSIVPVDPPYEREVQLEETDYGFSGHPPVVFFAEVNGALAGRIRVLTWWNQFGYIEDLAVNPEFRGQGLGRKLLERGIQWARETGHPGVMLETQDDNVPACSLYASCGFVLSGFDRNVYKAVNPGTRETALYWYLFF